MPSTSTSHQHTIPPTHEDFRWIFGPGREEKFADFIELTRDLSAGIHTCLQIIYTSDLVREENQDAQAEQEATPAIGKTEAGQLFRLSMTAAARLRDAADERIASLNKFWDA